MSRNQKRRKAENVGEKPKKNARQDLPDENLIIGVKDFISPKGSKYKIILTDENDPYEENQKDSQEGCQKEYKKKLRI